VTTILYARVSTVDQTIAHQEAQARKAGFTIDQIVSDHGVSGVRVPLSERPEGRRLFDVPRHTNKYTNDFRGYQQTAPDAIGR
jgi:putative DNA-invertase from lambdoid prophage Rac